MTGPDDSLPAKPDSVRTRENAGIWLIASQALLVLASPLLFQTTVLILFAGQSGHGPTADYGLVIMLGWFILPLGTVICCVQAWQKFRRNEFATAVKLTTLPLVLALLWLSALSALF